MRCVTLAVGLAIAVPCHAASLPPAPPAAEEPAPEPEAAATLNRLMFSLLGGVLDNQRRERDELLVVHRAMEAIASELMELEKHLGDPQRKACR